MNDNVDRHDASEEATKPRSFSVPELPSGFHDVLSGRNRRGSNELAYWIKTAGSNEYRFGTDTAGSNEYAAGTYTAGSNEYAAGTYTARGDEAAASSENEDKGKDSDELLFFDDNDEDYPQGDLTRDTNWKIILGQQNRRQTWWCSSVLQKGVIHDISHGDMSAPYTGDNHSTITFTQLQIETKAVWESLDTRSSSLSRISIYGVLEWRGHKEDFDVHGGVIGRISGCYGVVANSPNRYGHGHPMLSQHLVKHAAWVVSTFDQHSTDTNTARVVACFRVLLRSSASNVKTLRGPSSMLPHRSVILEGQKKASKEELTS
jgi:hypothetical protein